MRNQGVLDRITGDQETVEGIYGDDLPAPSPLIYVFLSSLDEIQRISP
jgi:hypothetical protein